MDYEFLDSSIDREDIILPDSDKINPFLLKNNYAEIIKAVDFIASDEKFLHVHGFLGTGKRQFINYICEFLNKDVIKLEYYCKEATVCDDILLAFIDIIERTTVYPAVNFNTKITTLGVRFFKQLSSIKKPFLIILHSFDDILEENAKYISDWLMKASKEENIKIIISTRALKPSVMGDLEEDKRIFLKAFTKDIFKEFLASNNIEASGRTLDDFYGYTRGYYYYTALPVKIMQAMKINLNEFLQKFNMSGLAFDSYLSATYINLIPAAIRNFFWFLRTIRHGLTLNALAIFDIYDEFSIEYLKNNLMIFQAGETIYVQDYFLQKIDISIPQKTEIKLHKYIIGIYEKQLKEPMKQRSIMISRQAMRAEIEYHNKCISELEQPKAESKTPVEVTHHEKKNNSVENTAEKSVNSKLEEAKALVLDKKYTGAIEIYKKILDDENADILSVMEARTSLAQLYKNINNYGLASYYYELAETYYKQHNEFINLNYLYYEMTDLYFKMYKLERAVETIKRVIYSVDTPQSLMVSACTLLGNIYSYMNNQEDAYTYYKKALDSLNENVEKEVLAELYFKYALANDDKGDLEQAFEYYNKCIACSETNPYKASAYSNLASCYYERDNYNNALACFKKAYEIEKSNNNYEGIYYNASSLAEVLIKTGTDGALDYLIEAKKSAEFINEDFYIMKSAAALGDYYYNISGKYTDCLKEYLTAKRTAVSCGESVNMSKIERRINDMKLRMKPEDYEEIMRNYG